MARLVPERGYTYKTFTGFWLNCLGHFLAFKTFTVTNRVFMQVKGCDTTVTVPTFIYRWGDMFVLVK